jgi:hypothetical protein
LSVEGLNSDLRWLAALLVPSLNVEIVVRCFLLQAAAAAAAAEAAKKEKEKERKERQRQRKMEEALELLDHAMEPLVAHASEASLEAAEEALRNAEKFASRSEEVCVNTLPQAHVNPTQAYVNPTQVCVNPTQAHVNPTHVCVNPTQVASMVADALPHVERARVVLRLAAAAAAAAEAAQRASEQAKAQARFDAETAAMAARNLELLCTMKAKEAKQAEEAAKAGSPGAGECACGFPPPLNRSLLPQRASARTASVLRVTSAPAPSNVCRRTSYTSLRAVNVVACRELAASSEAGGAHGLLPLCVYVHPTMHS